MRPLQSDSIVRLRFDWSDREQARLRLDPFVKSPTSVQDGRQVDEKGRPGKLHDVWHYRQLPPTPYLGGEIAGAAGPPEALYEWRRKLSGCSELDPLAWCKHHGAKAWL